MEKMQAALAGVVQKVFGQDVRVELTRPEPHFGDYATNVAMQLAGKLQKNPREIAEQLAAALKNTLGPDVNGVTIAGPGFINITASDTAIAAQALVAPTTKPATYKGQVVVAEYSDPNPFKVLHAGHMYTSVVGFAISNLLEAAGGKVYRVNFGGDVGLHVAKTMWAILKELDGVHPEKLEKIPEADRSVWMAARYVEGTEAYEDDANKSEIIALNKRVYDIYKKDSDPSDGFIKIYKTCRQWSYDYFDAFYERIGTPFDRYYPESETAPIGLKTVAEQLEKGVYEKSEGAVVFRGEPYGLHTRVFINSEELPTYEAKDVGLIVKKWQDYNFDRSIVITGNDIVEYMKVVLKSVEQFMPNLAYATTHITHGMVKLRGGVKMSSRKGNILRAVDVLNAASEANKQATGREDERAVLGAVKYSFLKQRIGADIIFDPKESVSLEGNSGPYLQYAHARARSILAKAGGQPSAKLTDLEQDERGLARKIGEYPEVLTKATEELMPHHICTYLYELAQSFNRFYEHNRILGESREAVRLKLVALYADVLKDGLAVLGIAAPDKM